MANYLDTFVGSNGTKLVGNSPVWTSTPSTVPNGTPVTYLSLSTYSATAVIESDTVFGAVGSTIANSWAVAQLTMDLNDPVQITFTWEGKTSGGSNVGFGYRYQPSGTYAGYYMAVTLACSTGLVKLFSFLNLTSTLIVETGDVSGYLTTGHSYTLTVVAIGMIHNVYLQDSSGNYLNLTGGSPGFASTKVPVISAASTWIMLPGQVAIQANSASTYNTGSPCSPITQAQAGGNIFLTPDLGVRVTGDTYIVFTILSSEGGNQPVTYWLQQEISSVWTNVLKVQPGIETKFGGLSTSTSYSFRASLTDSSATPVTLTSPTISVTTNAALNVTPPTLVTSSSPLTKWVNGYYSGGTPSVSIGYDTAGNALKLHLPWIFYDWQTSLLYAYGQYYPSGTSAGPNLYGYASNDGMNWTSLGHMIGATGNNTTFVVNSVTYNGMELFKVYMHATNGLYYAMGHVHNQSTSLGELLVMTASSPAGPWSYGAALQPQGDVDDLNDCGLLVDYDGSAYVFFGNNTTDKSYVLRLDPSWLTIADYTPNQITQAEGFAPFRMDHAVGCLCCLLTYYQWNANFGQVTGNMMGGVGTSLTTIPNSTIYTTAAQALAAPAGIADSVSDLSGSPYYPAAGINPAYSYGSQTCSVAAYPSGDLELVADRWNYAGADPVSTIIRLPLVFTGGDGGYHPANVPTIPFTASFTPNTGITSRSSTKKWFPGLDRRWRARRLGART